MPMPAQMRTAESEARAAQHEQQRARERETSVDPKDVLLAWVLYHSLTTVKMDARRLRRKNV